MFQRIYLSKLLSLLLLRNYELFWKTPLYLFNIYFFQPKTKFGRRIWTDPLIGTTSLWSIILYLRLLFFLSLSPVKKINPDFESGLNSKFDGRKFNTYFFGWNWIRFIYPNLESKASECKVLSSDYSLYRSSPWDVVQLYSTKHNGLIS